MSNDNGTVKVDTLPFYGEASRGEYAVQKEEASFLQEGFKVVREGVNEGVGVYRDAKDSVNHVIETGQAHSSVAYNQLREEENLPARLAIISGAGLVGLMVGALRGRFLKKMFYSGLGAGAGTAFCYPEEAKEAGDVALQEGKRNALIAYSFVMGETSRNEAIESSLIASNINRIFGFVVRTWRQFFPKTSQVAGTGTE